MIKYIYSSIIWAVLIILTSVLPCHADIYRYVDSKGRLHFADVPKSSNYRIYIRERPAKSSNSYSTNKYDRYITEASKKHDVSFLLLKAIINVESDFNPKAVSKAGALGLMQIMPENIIRFSIRDPFNPGENIMGGTCYLKELLERYNGKLPLALAAYNAGPTMVDRYNDIPPIKETQNYVKKVMKSYNILINKKG
ncbi:MAG TPA: lytic transglycosylase domain-containing protein [Anaerolineae bacterium]|nr:lytic transglycosylase domain-containing protein [Anaerolineae bacterium]